MSIDRAALIEAATEAAQRIVASPQFNTNAVQRTVDAVLVATVMPAAVDAVLPLIADAIEADAHALKHRIAAASADLDRPLARTMLSEVDGRILAARLVRSLLSTDSDR